jgi:hypothetical protein
VLSGPFLVVSWAWSREREVGSYFAGFERKRSRSLRLIEKLLRTAENKGRRYSLAVRGLAELVKVARTASDKWLMVRGVREECARESFTPLRGQR